MIKTSCHKQTFVVVGAVVQKRNPKTKMMRSAIVVACIIDTLNPIVSFIRWSVKGIVRVKGVGVSAPYPAAIQVREIQTSVFTGHTVALGYLVAGTDSGHGLIYLQASHVDEITCRLPLVGSACQPSHRFELTPRFS